jgi:FAD-dependent urate hydroxylase
MSSEMQLLSPVRPTESDGPSRVPDTEVAVIGAGPYGLSVAAHLQAAGVDVRILGKPMEFWADKMPAGMLLRSPRVASNISDPSASRTLDAFELANGIAPAAPIPLETFVNYGQWFQRKLTSNLDQREVAAIEVSGNGFRILLNEGTSFLSKRVVVAAGIGPFQQIPKVFRSLPAAQVIHCYSGFNVSAFAGKRTAVIGAGQSSLESAALLHEAGAEVEVIARIADLRWIGQHPWLHRLGPISSLLYSKHDIGPAGISRLVAAPNLVRRVPLKWRDKIRVRAVRSAGSTWLPARLKDVTIKTGRFVAEARSSGSQVQLKLNDGSVSSVDHVILGTGYSVDISRYKFLPPAIVKRVQVFGGYPVLDSGFSSSLPGLHFLGAPAARTFGPLLYFVAGTEFSSTVLTSEILKHRLVAR